MGRLIFRFAHSEVVRKREEYENSKKALIERRKKRHEEIMAVSDNTAHLRKEVCDLRELHRRLTKRQANRKMAYFRNQRHQEQGDAKALANVNAIVKPGLL